MEPPDRLEKGIRFGCGFLFGSLVTVGWLLTSLWDAHKIIACCLLAGLLCGYAALRFGDTFWENVSRWWWAWW
jgi:hypothetical protein